MRLSFWVFLKTAYEQRATIWIMATRALAEQYVGTFAGPLWTVMQPAATVVVYWFVFSVGFKAHAPAGVPFILYFLGGYVPWLLFTEVVQASSTAIVSNVHLVKKTTFPTEILPLVRVASSTIPHFILLLLFALIVVVSHGALSWSLLPWLVYFYVCLVSLALGLSWLVASLQVFSRDTAQVVTVVMNLWFWITPIAYPENILPPHVVGLLKANPMFYIISGYRHAFLGTDDFVTGFRHTVAFWALAALSLILGAYVFRRLKPEFPDVL